MSQNYTGFDNEATSTTPLFALGTIVWAAGGKCFVYVQAGEILTGDGYVVFIDNAYQALLLDTDVAATVQLGNKIGVIDVAFADNDYGWAQVYGPCGIRTEQDAAANVLLAATGDAGQVDDAGAGPGGLYIEGMFLHTATGGADAVNTSGELNWPILDTIPEIA
jgi:hypothetical protein